jgi:tellurite resistance protein TehA-like permease
MSAPDNAPQPPRYTGGQILMTVFGVILLLPGLCSLLFMLTMISELSFKEPMGGTIVTVWIICLAISAVGVGLVYAARKDAGKPRP